MNRLNQSLKIRPNLRLKVWMLSALLAAGAGYALSVYAVPMPGPGQEVYIVYYADASRSSEVGVRAMSHDTTCDSWHVTWGRTSAYSRVFVTDCIVNSGTEF